MTAVLVLAAILTATSSTKTTATKFIVSIPFASGHVAVVVAVVKYKPLYCQSWSDTAGIL